MESRKTGQKSIAEFIGITKATDPPRLLLESPALSVLLPSYDFVKAETGTEIGGAIHLEYRRYLVKLEGRNLGRLFAAIHVNEVAAISERKEGVSHKPTDCFVSRIIVAPLEAEKVEEEEEDFPPADG